MKKPILNNNNLVPDSRYSELLAVYKDLGANAFQRKQELNKLKSDYQYFLQEYFDLVELPRLEENLDD